jgi:hypothetical protein
VTSRWNPCVVCTTETIAPLCQDCSRAYQAWGHADRVVLECMEWAAKRSRGLVLARLRCEARDAAKLKRLFGPPTVLRLCDEIETPPNGENE